MAAAQNKVEQEWYQGAVVCHSTKSGLVRPRTGWNTAFGVWAGSVCCRGKHLSLEVPKLPKGHAAEFCFFASQSCRPRSMHAVMAGGREGEGAISHERGVRSIPVLPLFVFWQCDCRPM